MQNAWTDLDPRLSLGLYILVAVAMVVAILAIARLVRARAPAKDGYGVYESGAPAAAASRTPVPTSYFQIAAFFVIFDFEAALLYTWAIAAPAAGWAGLISATIFIIVLLGALFYLWADGALDTGPRQSDAR